MGAVNQLLAKHDVEVRRGRVNIHPDQGIVERFSWILVERLFGHQYAQEMRLPSETFKHDLWHKSPPLLFQAVLLAFATKSSLQVLVFAICTIPASWKAVVDVRLIQYGLWRFIGLGGRWPNEQQVDAAHVGRLFAEVVDNYPFFPAKDVDRQVICFSTPGTWEVGAGASIPSQSKLSWVGYWLGLSTCGRIWGLIAVSNGDRGHPCFSH